MSSLTNVFNESGYITPVDMWPRHSKHSHRETGDRIPHEAIAQNEAVFEELYSILLEHPMSVIEWNKCIRASKHNTRISQAQHLLPFEHWVSLTHPGHMPYITTKEEMGIVEWLCWRRCGTRHRTNKKTVFICLLGISYSP